MAQDKVDWRLQPWQMGVVLIVLALAVAIFWQGLGHMVWKWGDEEYSHGYMLPFVAGFLVWQRLGTLRQTAFRASWWGVLLTALGLFTYLVGELGTLYSVIQYGFLITLGGLLLSFMGLKAFVVILPAYALLFFMVPLPNFLYENLSAELQLVSSRLGVAIIRLFGVSVFLEGNVIDLGTYKLQVVEACSGLRYLFPLTALGFIAAVIFKGALWKKVVLFLSTIPITVLMNSLRIAVIGLLVEYAGIEVAEGFLHDFEGWIVFMACGGLLVLQMALLARVGRDRLPLREAFAVEGPRRLPSESVVRHQVIPASFFAAALLLLAGAVVSQALPSREEQPLERRELLFFPMTVDGWRGDKERMERAYLDTLKLDDYLLADFTNLIGDSVQLYVAYYASQRKGASVHSPKSCLPGGGWRIEELTRQDIDGVRVGDHPLRVNRALIRLGESRQLVYYWFQQRGRVMTNEFIVKWYLFWDALTRNRTDGALVRLTMPVQPGQDLAEADARVSGFARAIAEPLQRFIPE